MSLAHGFGVFALMDQSTDGFDARSAEAIRNELRQHDACFEIWPLYEVIDGKLTRSGAELDLCAAPDHGAGHICPGCKDCRETFRLLQDVAKEAMSHLKPGCHEEVQAFDSALHMSPRRRFRPEVVLAIQITSNAHNVCSVDEDLAQLQSKLVSLGVRPA
jgi:hypothetical protein